MRAHTVVMGGLAAVFGLLAVFVAQAWLNSQAEIRMKNIEANKQPIAAVRTIVVAASPLRFGAMLSPRLLREVPWPEETVPAGSFASVSDLLSSGKRVVLAAFEVNEPILASKITGAGQRATLSAVLHEGMKAVTVRVTDIEGVAGFVLPGDRVDVLMTRNVEKGSNIADVVLQGMRVLAIDQIADERTDKPAIVRAVTLEVDTQAAQKIALAASVGSLSLILRKAGETSVENTRRITLEDLNNNSAPKEARRSATIVVIRAAKQRQEYSVPIEGAEWRNTSVVGQGELRP